MPVSTDTDTVDTEPMEPTPIAMAYGKRSADAEPDPALLYTTSNVVSPLTTAYYVVPAVIYTHSVANDELNVPKVAYSGPQVAYTHTPVVKTVVPQVATYTVP